ncbi:conserved exported protein of unknown function [Sterolibacterium denitrificans]|uniref:Porin domain-containing protein n=1 Tax=Sterolibacterium denitrificans TaxID=157592 RepID=A0A7Z7HS13_9PROT|nr:porin [Sterolibacterium denitrificans]SMB27290.1 conserved exported protein of unknown function [Sterolibacterium denitrificans]
MKKICLASSLCAALGLTFSGNTLADTQFNLSGFGTFGVTHSNEREADYRSLVFQPNGPGNSGAWRSGVDTKAGAQLSANFGNGLTGIAQVVVDHRGDNSYSPLVEWLNLKYNVNNNLYVRAGRMLLPTFMVSETRNIGYAQTAVRMPTELYYLNPITHMDGIDIGANVDIGGGNLAVTLNVGKSKDVMKAYKLEGRRLANLGVTYEIGASQFHANYLKSKLSIKPYDNHAPGTTANLNAYFQSVAALQSVPATGYSTPNILINDLDTKLWSLGYSYDANNWIVQTEYARRKVDGQLVRDLEAAYVLAGYRVGKFTPYLTISRLRDKESAAYPPAVLLGDPFNPNPLQPISMAALVVNLTDASAIREEQKAFAAGVRYDLMPNVALKAQFEVIKKPGSIASPNAGSFANASPLFTTSDRSIKLFTATVDFLF